MKLRIVISAAAAALLAACGADESACTTTSAKLADGTVVPTNCTAAAGFSVNIPVNLCANCRATRTACQAEYRNGVVEIDPIFYECEETSGCTLNPACENNPATRQASCSVSIPSNVSGQIPIVAATGTVGTLQVTSGTSSCTFAANDAP